MLYRFCVSALVVLNFATVTASGQTPSLAAFDEATLRQAGVATDAASLLSLLHEHTRSDCEPERIKDLIAQLASPQFERREAATQQLIAAGRPALLSLKDAQKHHEDPEVRQSAAHCVAAIENLLDPNLTMAAVRRLVHLRANGAAGPLLALLPNVDWEIQDEIFHGLPQVALRDGKLDPALLVALEDGMPVRRAAAALTVALAGSGEQIARVRRMLDDRDAEVRLRTAQGLLAVREAASLPVLIALLNDLAVEISWSAEELLHWVAGAKAPAEKIGAASASERKKAVAAWTEWLQSSGRHLDWNQLEQTPRRPGLYLACDENSLWLGGCDGVRRWSQTMKNPAHDAVLFPGNRVMVVPCNDRTEVMQCDLDGTVLWSQRQRIFHDYLLCQRLPNGHCLLVSDLDVVEITAEGREVSEVVFAESLSIHDAWQPRFGPMLCREREGVTAVERSSGRVVCAGEMPRCDLSMCKFAVQPEGRCVISNGNNSLLEVNCGGQTLRVLPVRGARSVEALRNGHYLVSTFGPDCRLLELDTAGHTLWEVYTPRTVHRVRSVLDKVRIGFDKPRPPDFNLDSAAQRVRSLQDPDPQVRARSMRFLHFLQPTDPDSITALVAALKDNGEGVRPEAVSTLAAIGEPAVPQLVAALKTNQGDDRIHLVNTLACIGPAAHKAVPELIALIDNDKLSVEMRRRAVIALGEIGSNAKRAVPALLGVLKCDCLPLRRIVPESLTLIAPNDPTVHAGLVAAVCDQTCSEGQEAAVDVLPSLGPGAKTALPALLDILKSPNASVPLRRKAAHACCCLRQDAEPALPVLVELLRDGKQPLDLRIAIAYSFRKLGKTGLAVLPVCGELLREPTLSDDLVEALFSVLRGIGPESIPVLARAVNEGNSRRRAMAIYILGDMGATAAPALPDLEIASKIADELTRARALVAISSIKDSLAARRSPLN